MIIYKNIEIEEVSINGPIITIAVPDIRQPNVGDVINIGSDFLVIENVGIDSGNWILTVEGSDEHNNTEDGDSEGD